MSNTIELQTKSILQVPLQNYAKDFVFIVNSVKFETNSLIADLLSTKISDQHMIDPTMKEFHINTKTQGDFQKILNLTSFTQQTIPNNEIPFIIEIFQKLGTKNIDFSITGQLNEITCDNAIDFIKVHQHSSQFFIDQITSEMNFISEHFFEMKEKFTQAVNDKENPLDEYVIDSIINNAKLQLESEDQLLETINEIYMKNSKYFYLYEYVDFTNVEITTLNEFISIFDFNDLTKNVWNSIVCRLQKKQSENKHFRKNKNLKVKEFLPKNEEFNGIIKYLIENSNINEEVDISASSYYCGNVHELLKFDKIETFFETKNEKNSWICFEFKKHKVIPSSYLIRTIHTENNDHLKSWVVQGSNDKDEWVTIDEQQNCDFLKGQSRVHLFEISKQNETPFKYIRIKQTGANWYQYEDKFHYLCMSAVEFFGKLV